MAEEGGRNLSCILVVESVGFEAIHRGLQVVDEVLVCEFFLFFFWGCLQDGMCEHSLCGSPWACTGAAGRVTIINQQRFENVCRGH